MRAPVPGSDSSADINDRGPNPKKSLQSYRWFIVWNDNGKRREVATGAEPVYPNRAW